jgi:hypothetical protein
VISNADLHGSDKTPINVVVRGGADDVEVTVQNRGPVIPVHELDKIFNPLHRIEGTRTARRARFTCPSARTQPLAHADRSTQVGRVKKRRGRREEGGTP